MPLDTTPPHRSSMRLSSARPASVRPASPRLSYVRRLALGAAAIGAAVTLSACGTSTSDATLGADGGPLRPVAGTGSLGAGFLDPSRELAPGETMAPQPGSWDDVHLPKGYSAVLISTDDSAPARRLSSAVKGWAEDASVDLSVIVAAKPSDHVRAIQQGIDQRRDLIISASESLADAMALITPSWMDQKFLVLGAELAEPTANVTAAIWPGVSYRGGVGGPSASDPTTYTVDRATRALEAGVAAVVQGYAGYVVSVE